MTAYWSPDQLLSGALGVVLTYGPVAALILARRSLGRLHAAAWLVMLGALIVAAEHAGFALAGVLSDELRASLSAHSRYHLFMAAAYTLVGAGMIGVVGHTLLRQGRRSGWWAVLLALVLGGGLELGAVLTIFPHGLPPRSIPAGLVLYAYPLAWAAALAISYRPIFRPDPGSSARRGEVAG